MQQIFMALVTMVFISGFCRCKKDNGPGKEKKAIITTVAGSGTQGFMDSTMAHAKFNHPWDIAVHKDGVIYVADLDNHRIRKIDTSGRVTTFAGNGTVAVINGNGTSAAFSYPCNIALDATGNVYVTDLIDSRIRKINSQADVSVFAGLSTQGFADGPVGTALFSTCRGIFTDAHGNIIVSDLSNQRVRKINTNGFVSTIAGSGIGGFADSVAAFAQFYHPCGVASDKQSNLYVVDYNNYRIRKITPGGIVSTLAGDGVQGFKDGKGSEARFHSLQDIVADNKGNVYITDLNCVRKITPGGEVSTIAGDGSPGFVDGEGAQARFNYPNGLAIDAEGNIYVADTSNQRIRKISFE
jgi:sugar lactone lactonase YvrE